MSDSALEVSQLRMARYLRNPAGNLPPEGIEPRRLKIYERLVYNNIEGFISGGFPVLRRLYDDVAWHALVRGFIDQHRCHTPYFLAISQEFVQFVMHGYRLQHGDPPFLAELAHYEWVELALDTSEETLPETSAEPVGDLLESVLHLSPLAWLLSYRYPVHRIGPRFEAGQAFEPTYLVVFRDLEDKVRFIELNAVTARLLELVRENTADTAATLLKSLAAESGVSEEAILTHGSKQLLDLIADTVVFVSRFSP